MMNGDKRLEILGYMNEHMPKTLVGYKIKDAVASADSYLDLPEIMVVLLCKLAEANEAIRTTTSELAKNSYTKTYVHDCGKTYQGWDEVKDPFRTTGINEGIYPTCNAEYGKL